MQTQQDIRSALYRVTCRLDELSAACDPEFDAVYEDLDREFAHLRLQCGNE